MNDNNASQKAELFPQSIEQISDNDHSHCLRINLKIVKKWSISHTLDLIFATLLFQEFVHKHEDYFGRFFFSNQ